MADGVIATISGTMLVPGLSQNRRLYTPDLISKTVKRMQERINDPNGLPIVMRSHHAAEDDSTRIAGVVTSVSTDESGAARYRANLYNTAAGRDITALVTPGKPALRSTSIHGYWLGPVQRVEHDGVTAETAPDLEVDKIDFTASPGVPGAVIDLCTSHPQESATMRTPISESYDARVELPGAEEKAAAPQTKATVYADPGYQGDKAPRYALDTKAQVKAAWSYINMPKNAKLYTAKQLARIKTRIKTAAGKFGIEISSDENWMIDTGELSEMYDDAMSRIPGSFCVRLCNGPVEVTVSSYSVDPADLDLVGRAAMDGACRALAALDPDWDADIDVPGSPGGEMGETTEPPGQLPVATQETPTQPGPPGVSEETSPGQPSGVSTTPQEVPTVSEATTEAATPVAPNRTLTDADVQAIGETIGASVGAAFATALKEHIPAPVPVPVAVPAVTVTTPATESTPKAADGTVVNEAMITALKETITGLRTDLAKSVTEAVTAETQRIQGEIRDELREDLKRAGIGLGRRGYRVHENTPTGGEPTPEELFADRANVLLGDFGMTPVPAPGTGTAPERIAQ